MKISDKIIKEIAEYLDCGMRCFLHKKTKNLITILDKDDWFDDDAGDWAEDIEEIDSNKADYIEFEKMDSKDSFRVMADFAENVDDTKLQERLINALNKPKPFRYFKWEIDNSGEYREKWFDFKNMRYIEYVKQQIEVVE